MLFVQKNSVYKSLTDSNGEPLDCWDEDRDALNWPGGNPIVAHPPCRLFCRLSRFSTAPESEKELAYWAIEQVRLYGGVVEQPAKSALWADCQLPVPGARDAFGFSYGLEQWWFGHPARKLTWLYIVGCGPFDLPLHPFSLGHAEHIIGKCRPVSGKKRSVLFDNSKQARSATPLAFAQWLIQTAEVCHGDKRIHLQ